MTYRTPKKQITPERENYNKLTPITDRESRKVPNKKRIDNLPLFSILWRI